MNERVCLVHYHEIGLKGKNRSTFENRLVSNLKHALRKFDVSNVARISGHLIVEATNGQADSELARAISRVPGVARVSLAYRCPLDEATYCAAAVDALSGVTDDWQTFKVHARRSSTNYERHTLEMNRIVGAALCDAFPTKKVLMHGPDMTVVVHAVQGDVYVYADTGSGVGGLPVGSSGRVMCLLSSGIDSPVAVWRLARRGAIPFGVHFSGRPQTASTSEYLVDDIAHVLEKSGCIARVYVVPFGDYQRAIAAQVPPELRIIMYRRLMFKVADALARKVGAKALVTGESLGQVASQTIENISVVNEATELPVFRPFIGTDKIEIIDQAQALGTFDISSQPAPDCCTLFMPRNPETHAKLDRVLEVEQGLPLDEWIPELVASAEPHDYRCPAVNYKKLNRQ